MKISGEFLAKVKKVFSVLGLISGLILLSLTVQMIDRHEGTGTLLLTLLFVGLPATMMVFFSIKIFRFANQTKDVHLWREKQVTLTDEQREELIQEKIREAVFAADAKKQKRQAKQESADANLDALQSLTELSREEIEKIAKQVRKSGVD
ncbi:hypothetical protein ACSLBF_04815 [Pseudoalteromonas sp. T1lg65]|uniref:hypothetical protein n=1 Tax=Pseudoalteromonas sp. T1lg65 TaxID=2077101 RepID=UPI003F7AC04A